MEISVAMYQSQFSNAPHPVLTIDGISLDVWLNMKTTEQDVLDLVPAQDWLSDRKDLVLAWQRITPNAETHSTIVPLLICPDDLDFYCTVVVVEQEVTDGQVIWHRFGFASDMPGEQFGTSVTWFKINASAIFQKEQFTNALVELNKLCEHVEYDLSKAIN